MKKLNLFLALCALSIGLSGQNSYGGYVYKHNNTTCTSGALGRLNGPGFILAGGSGNFFAAGANFYIDRTGVNGVPAGPGTFQSAYKIVLCNGVQAIDCNNVKVIETSTGNYAVTGVADNGIFFAELLPNGNVANYNYYPFPYTVNNASEALITESAAYPNTFYIVGSYDGIMYMMRVDNFGNIGPQLINEIVTSGYYMTPHAIIESPFGPQDLVIVGGGMDNGNMGFYYQIDNNLITSSARNFYFHGTASSHNSGFNGITVSNSPSYGPGFLVAGHSRSPVGLGGEVWTTRFDMSGNMFWSSIVQGTIAQKPRGGIDVTERFSAVYNTFENYTIANSSQGIMVYKLDENGTPMSMSYGIPDEFSYNLGPITNPNTRAVAITNNNVGTPQDEGLHIYGALVGGGAHYLAESYFSGETGCNLIGKINNFDQSMPNMMNFPDNNPSIPWQPCAGALYDGPDNSFGFTCGPNPALPPPASNNRLMAATGIDKNDNSGIAIYPNPSKDKIYISGDNAAAGNMVIKLTDVLGRTITLNENLTLSNGAIEIDLSKLNIAKGVYYLEAGSNGSVIKQKIIYTAQ